MFAAQITNESWGERIRKRSGRWIVDHLFLGAEWIGRHTSLANPRRYRVEVVKDVPYRDTGDDAHRLDVYRPIDRSSPLPALLYAHGGGFRFLSKDTHWLMALRLARRGFVVFNINYRLAPRDPFPAAVADTADAYGWVVENGPAFGARGDQVLLAGESAGANLVTALTVGLCYERPEPYLRAACATGIRPRAVLPACGMYQVTDPGRLARQQRLPFWTKDLLTEIPKIYLPRDQTLDGEALDLADPVVLLERNQTPPHPLPPFFLGVGTNDPLVDDTRRLDAALRRLGAVCETRYYPKGWHAFHAFVWHKQAKTFWRDTFAFLERFG